MNSLKKYYNSYILFCLLICFLACKKEPGNLPATNIKWEKYQGITSQVGLMNSSFNKNQLNILGPSSFFKDVSKLSSGNTPNTFKMGLFEGIGRLKFPVPDQFYVFTNKNLVTIRSASTVESESVERIIDINLLDPDFYTLIDIPYWQGECMTLSDNNFILVPYKAVNNNNSIPTPYFVLAKIDAPDGRNNDIKIEHIKLIKENIFPGETTVNRMQTFFNSFFVVMGPNTYRIDSLGKIGLVSEKALNIYKHGEELFAFAPNYNSKNVDYFKSTDQGKSWLLLGDLSADILVNLQYTVLNNKVIGFVRGQLFQFETSGTYYSIIELENEGLGLGDITSISMANDNTVFITSHCNTFTDICGGFYKPLEYFFEKKKP